MTHRLARLAAALPLLSLAACAPQAAPAPAPVADRTAPAARALSPVEQRIVEAARARHAEAVALLQRTVDLNSGTLNPAGVRRVAEAMRPELEALGFAVRIVDQAHVGRGPHLVAERRGTRGRRLLLIGHLDTVFEDDSPFQRFERIDEHTARGPGVNDMKGGNVVIVHALRALHDAGVLEGATITVVLTGDEESPGLPLSESRRDLIEAARRSDVALGFETGSRDTQGDLAVIGRRSSSSWELRVTGRGAHSSGVFSEGVGAGAVYEAARILTGFYEELRDETGATFSPGIVLGGSETAFDAAAGRGGAAGKTNVVAEHAFVRGDLRTLSAEQQERVRARMRTIVARHLPRTGATIEFFDGYPAMTPSAESEALLRDLSQLSVDLGYGPVRPFDPARRGAADISFVAPIIPGIDALGPEGAGAHSVQETVDLRSLRKATERAALLVYRLISG